MLSLQLFNFPVSEVLDTSIAIVHPESGAASVLAELEERELSGAVVVDNVSGIAGVALPETIRDQLRPGISMREITLVRPAVIAGDASVYSLFSDGNLAFGPGSLVVDKSGTPLGFVALRQLVDRLYQQLRYANQVLQTVLRTVTEPVTIIDEKGRVQSWNEAAERSFGVKAEEILGNHIGEFFEDLVLYRVLREKADVRHVYHQIRPGCHLLVNGSPIFLDDKLVGAVASDQDITSIVELNQELFATASEVQALRKEITKLSPNDDAFRKIKGRGAKISKATGLAQKVAPTNATVLIRGESGVGKELFAEAIHSRSPRSQKPFIVINCGAIPPALFESELFGYHGGAFTGADPRGSPGKFELVNGGTLFLDEIGELPLELQVKLLRVLQERVFYRVGGKRPIHVDVRIIAATNCDLEGMIAKGKFRSDLYYRLNVVSVEVPPLRQRKEDIPELTYHFAQDTAIHYGKPVPKIEPELMAAFINYDWPGNIRELRNVIERLVILSEGNQLRAADLPEDIRVPQSQGSAPPAIDPNNLPRAKEETERSLIEKALAEAGGNRTEAARILGISRGALYYKMKSHSLH